MEFTEAEANLNDLVAEYQQYQVKLCYVTLAHNIRVTKGTKLH